MSTSSLANLSCPAYWGNYTCGRNGKKIRAITVHHMAARMTAQRCGELFQAPGREGSAHYGIGYDGKIASYVDENDTAWANSNWDSNCESVTIECSNSAEGGDWPVSDATRESLIRLMADIAIRNGLGKLVKGENLTWHRMFTSTTCPGEYLLSQLDFMIQKANEMIEKGKVPIMEKKTPVNISYQAYTYTWLPNVQNAQDFAGIYGQPIQAIYAHSDRGELIYQVHVKGGDWLPAVKNREDFAGILGEAVDGIMIRHDTARIHYRVHTIEDGWLPAVTGFDPSDPVMGYAGILGHSIDAVVIWADPVIEEETFCVENDSGENQTFDAGPDDMLKKNREGFLAFFIRLLKKLVAFLEGGSETWE